MPVYHLSLQICRCQAVQTSLPTIKALYNPLVQTSLSFKITVISWAHHSSTWSLVFDFFHFTTVPIIQFDHFILTYYSQVIWFEAFNIYWVWKQEKIWSTTFWKRDHIAICNISQLVHSKWPKDSITSLNIVNCGPKLKFNLSVCLPCSSYRFGINDQYFHHHQQVWSSVIHKYICLKTELLCFKRFLRDG